VLRLAADENFNNDILDGLLLRNPALNIVRAQDVGLSGAEDPDILDWAAREGRILLTHDVKTMPPYAYQRVAAGQPMPGVVEVNPAFSVGRVIDDLLILAECSREGEWEGRILFLPL
jgi:hypothetical protein